jgi:hypothetical protein
MSDTIAHLRTLEQQATPGPWSFESPASTGGRWPRPDYFVRYTIDDDGIHGGTDADLDFIVAMRNALPKLLDVVEAAREALPVLHDVLSYPDIGSAQRYAALRDALAALAEEQT